MSLMPSEKSRAPARERLQPVPIPSRYLAGKACQRKLKRSVAESQSEMPAERCVDDTDRALTVAIPDSACQDGDSRFCTLRP